MRGAARLRPATLHERALSVDQRRCADSARHRPARDSTPSAPPPPVSSRPPSLPPARQVCRPSPPPRPGLPPPPRHDMSVILVTGSYDHEIRFWEAWSGICSRTIARSGETGVRSCFSLCDTSSTHTVIYYDMPVASQSTRNLTRVRPRVAVFPSYSLNPPTSKRLLAAAIHKKVNIYEIASSSSTPVITVVTIGHRIHLTTRR